MTSHSFAIDPARMKYFSGSDPRGNQSLREMHRHRNLQSGIDRRMKRNEKRSATPYVNAGAGLGVAGLALNTKKVSRKIGNPVAPKLPGVTPKNVRRAGKAALVAGVLSTAKGIHTGFDKPKQRRRLDTQQSRLAAERDRTERRVQRHVSGIRRRDKYVTQDPVVKSLTSALRARKAKKLDVKFGPKSSSGLNGQAGSQKINRNKKPFGVQ